MKRKFLSLFFAFVMLAAVVPVLHITEVEAAASINIGDYVQMGTYYGEPILWRCVDIDENGPLMLSDRIICLKPFDAGTSANSSTGSHSRSSYSASYGSNYWADSNMRSWLNSSESAGNVTWLCGNPPSEDYIWNDGYNDYADEAGFLTNFTQSELNAIKTVTQKSIVAYPEYENGIYTSGTESHTYNNHIEDVVQNYDSAYSEQVTDTMFLLDVKQVNAVYNNGSILGSDYYIGKPTEQCVLNSEYTDSSLSASQNRRYWLRSPLANDKCNFVRGVDSDGRVDNGRANSVGSGVRPAFYLNSDFCTFESGSGTAASPYTVSDSGGTTPIPAADDTSPSDLNNTTFDLSDGETTITSFDSKVSTWAKEEIEDAYSENLVPDVLISEDLTQQVDRAEFAAIAVALYENLSGKTAETTQNQFVDISGNACKEDIIKAYNLNITNGTSEYLYEPDSLITREQVATMLTRAYKRSEFADWSLANDSNYALNYMGVQKFDDDDQISDYAKESVYFMVKWGVINGVGDNKFAPNETTTLGEDYGFATREEALVIALRSAKYL